MVLSGDQIDDESRHTGDKSIQTALVFAVYHLCNLANLVIGWDFEKQVYMHTNLS